MSRGLCLESGEAGRETLSTALEVGFKGEVNPDHNRWVTCTSLGTAGGG